MRSEESMVFSNDLGPWTRVNTSRSNKRASMQKKLLLKFACGEERLAIESGDIGACSINQASVAESSEHVGDVISGTSHTINAINAMHVSYGDLLEVYSVEHYKLQLMQSMTL